MNSINDPLHQTRLINQKPTSSFKSLKPLALLATGLFIAVVAGAGGYWLGIRTSQKSEIISQPTPTVSPTTDKTTTVIIQDDYFFKVTIPREYRLIERSGDYIRYIMDRSGEEIIGFYISSGLGERLPTGQTVIDGVPFTVMYTYRGAISCSASLYATNAQFKLGHLYFGINTWCKDAKEKKNDVYEQVIRSIQFSEDLRAVLIGKSPPPMLRY